MLGGVAGAIVVGSKIAKGGKSAVSSINKIESGLEKNADSQMGNKISTIKKYNGKRYDSKPHFKRVSNIK